MTSSRARRLLRLWRVLLACVVVAFAARPAPTSVVVDTVVLVAQGADADAGSRDAARTDRRLASRVSASSSAPRAPAQADLAASLRPFVDRIAERPPDRPRYILHRALLC